ncbi:hypothetical protein FC32_GL001718 [Ligilactobacillus apodemi DSM 16634 = JCM 16172]|uniref:Uncharacterized protein n=1 Tax=Ligilactobacillus apodemi DSM 16634 = JCM 16172 TaxID=1423724 RepID=A0A0R1U1P3_9LACO|nr:hypothetical protein [Ligilactobacillus apodemi]KRL87295.1 hypothetical protein FC32_GL001718 [Ligilactobacillus apodemi DSM 16634 = JCM 16172]MCR1901775.1 hypothetical protein [Ligilactobacillus apodemi]
MNKDDIVSAQVIDVKAQKITVKTEENEVIEVSRPKSTMRDTLFLKTMTDILKSGLWIPVNKKLKQLLRYDWFETPIEKYSF